MAGSTFGNQFKITTWGESHGKAVGVVIDGCPAGLALTESDIQYYLNLRKPGQSVIQHHERKRMPLRSCQEFLKAEQQARLSLSLFTTKMHVLPTIRILPDTIVPDMQIILLTKNTDSATTEAADVLQGGKPSEELQQVPLLLKY